MQHLWNILGVAGLIVGFGFVVFIHELGHFLAAKYVGIRCEQFAVGFGHAIIAWRRGIGMRRGTTAPEFDRRIREHLNLPLDSDKPLTGPQIDRGCEELGLGETEYRWNWIPLGGYVKMVGQDDMDASATSDDPRSFSQTSVGARALVISAGVIFNVILAAVMFIGLFLTIGLNSHPATIGFVQYNSPAQLAGLRVGDTILDVDGWEVPDFTKLSLATALLPPDQSVGVTVRRPDGTIEKVQVQPRKSGDSSMSFFSMGVEPSPALQGMSKKQFDLLQSEDPAELKSPDILHPGDRVVKIGDTPVASPADYYLLSRALSESAGKPVKLTVTDVEGRQRTINVSPAFGSAFGNGSINIAGMLPRPRVLGVMPDSPASVMKLQKDDLIIAMKVGTELVQGPSNEEVRTRNFDAGAKGLTVSYQISRGGKVFWTPAVVPTFRVGTNERGVGMSPSADAGRPVVTSCLPETPAASAGIPDNTLITRVDGQAVSNWPALRAQLLKSGATAELTGMKLDPETDQPVAGSEKQYKLALSSSDQASLAAIPFVPAEGLAMAELRKPRKTSSPLVALRWGLMETRDLLLQFYITLKRTFVDHTVSAKNFMGPIGIVHSGSFFASRGIDWLVWFLAMISANLAVVNFLPIPIMDGGLFAILIAEKVRGKPINARTQVALQYVGLAIILGVFLFVTYNDLRRLFF